MWIYFLCPFIRTFPHLVQPVWTYLSLLNVSGSAWESFLNSHTVPSPHLYLSKNYHMLYLSPKHTGASWSPTRIVMVSRPIFQELSGRLAAHQEVTLLHSFSQLKHSYFSCLCPGTDFQKSCLSVVTLGHHTM